MLESDFIIFYKLFLQNQDNQKLNLTVNTNKFVMHHAKHVGPLKNLWIFGCWFWLIEIHFVFVSIISVEKWHGRPIEIHIVMDCRL